MRIGIDGRFFKGRKATGIENCVYEILNIWVKEYPQHEYYLFNGDGAIIDIDFPDNWHMVTMKSDPSFIKIRPYWTVFQIPKAVKKYKLDAFWGTNFVLPKKVKGTDYYVTMYDLALFKFKGIGELYNVIRLKIKAKKACLISKKVIAISNSTARDVNEIFNIQQDKIEVSYCGGVPSDYSQGFADEANIGSTIKSAGDYFLFMSTIEPRKNVETIVKAFDLYKEKSGSSMKLILAGQMGWKSKGIELAIKNAKYTADIILPGYVNRDEKDYLFSNAKGFLYPSIYEGFGIPILEAFEYGIPVITTNVSSMPEVGGEAAFYINNPLDENELANKMIELEKLNDKNLVAMKNKMLQQKEKFSWQKNAHEMLEIIKAGSEK